MSKKNLNKSKASQRERQTVKLKQAGLEGAKYATICLLESFKAVGEELNRESLTIREIIEFIELSQKFLEKENAIN